MQIKILGSGAGGGFPQWNCNCTNCRQVRSGELNGIPRSQSQVALSADNEKWILLNASPDLREQLMRDPSFHPNSRSNTEVRSTPIQSIVLTNADLDHVLGLLLMRESQKLRIYSTRQVKKILLETNSIFGMLQQSQGQIEWEEIELEKKLPLRNVDGSETGLQMTAYSLGEKLPRYAEGMKGLNAAEGTIGLVIEGKSGKNFGFFPSVSDWSLQLESQLKNLDLVFFDGTFYEENELQESCPTARTAKQMGHLPINQSLPFLQSLDVDRKVYFHINNTNPILNESSLAHSKVREGGVEIGYDGWETSLV